MSNFFLICSSYFSKLTKDTEPILPQDKQQGCRLAFVPTKFPSSSMTPSFFLVKILHFLKNVLSYFVFELLYLRTEN